MFYCVLLSSSLRNHLLSVPFKKLKLSHRLRVGEGRAMVMIDDISVEATQPMAIGAMIDSVLKHEIGLTFDEAWDTLRCSLAIWPRRM